MYLTKDSLSIDNTKEAINMDEPKDPKPGPSGLQTPGQGTGDGSESEDEENKSSRREISIQRVINSLVHSVQCQETYCQVPYCRKLKRIMAHTKSCKRKANGGCPVCKQLIALCCYHAKVCNEPRCSVPFCLNIKQKMREEQLQQRLQERTYKVNLELLDDNCIICQNREKTTVLVPCGHSDYCLQCVLEWHKNGDPEKEQTCPICREPIEQVIPFSFSKFLT